MLIMRGCCCVLGPSNASIARVPPCKTHQLIVKHWSSRIGRHDVAINRSIDACQAQFGRRPSWPQVEPSWPHPYTPGQGNRRRCKMEVNGLRCGLIRRGIRIEGFCR